MNYPLRGERFINQKPTSMCDCCHRLTSDWAQLPTDGAIWCVACIGNAVKFYTEHKAKIAQEDKQNE